MKKKPIIEQPELAGAPVPQVMEYHASGEVWRCNRFDLLVAEFGLPTGKDAGAALAGFHAVSCVNERRWMMVRRLFGLMPMFPAPGTAADDLRVWGREELTAALGLSRAQLAAELDAVRGGWSRNSCELRVSESVRGKPQDYKTGNGTDGTEGTEAKDAKPAEELNFRQEDYLAKQGFGMLKFASHEEAEWFTVRVRAYEKILREPLASQLGRNALMNELRIRQLDRVLNATTQSIGGAEWTRNVKLRDQMDATYQKQVEQLKEMCPWAVAIAGKWAFSGTLASVTQAIQLYHSQGDTRLIDGIFTATEVQVECRRSTQAPEPRYRAGLVVHLNAARAGLWDPNWKPPLTNGELKRMDAAWKAAYVAGAPEGERVPDLEAEGAAGEYGELNGKGKSEKAEGKSE